LNAYAVINGAVKPGVYGPAEKSAASLSLAGPAVRQSAADQWLRWL